MTTERKSGKVEAITVGPELPAIPEGPVTEESLEAEAAAMGDSFSEVTAHPADLIADSEEMIEGRADLPDLQEREYPVTEHHFQRLVLLSAVIGAVVARAGRTDAFSPLQTAEADAAKDRLIALRGFIGGIGKAAGLTESLFSLETNNSQRLNVVMMRMEVVLENVGEYRARMPDKKKLDAYVVEARGLIDAQKAARRRARFMRADRTIDTRKQERYERLLLNVLQYVSAQGLAAYPDDPVREARYRLDHVYGRKASKAGDPGAGGPAPTPTA